MVHYPDCPFCGNSNSALSIVEVEIAGIHLKGVQCNNSMCGKFLGFYMDYEEEVKEIKESIEELQNSIENS